MKPLARILGRFRSLPLKSKAQAVGALTFCLMILLSTGCIAALGYYNYSFKRLFDTSYLQSGAMTQMRELRHTIEMFESDPGADTRQLVEDGFADGWALFERFPDDPRRQSEEARLLNRAVLRTYATYEKRVQELFRMSIYDLRTTEYYVKYYEIEEIGSYINTYLEQIIQENLREGNSLYQTQSRILYAVPFVFAVLLLLSGMVLTGMLRWFSGRILQPVVALADAARTLAANRMDIPDVPVPGGEDEIGDLTRTFNRMKDDCRSLLTAQQEKEELTRELYEERLEHIDAENRLSAAQLAVLKQQINPHFLFNTLTLISETARQESADDTESLIQQLSVLLRHNLYTRQDRVSLQQELDMLYSYMYIQESRFLDRVVFWVECEVPLDAYSIPTFTLQPLVENAVSHGVVPKEAGGVIRVKIYPHGGALRITVTDNGVGMEKAVLDRLNSLEDVPEGQNSGIGVVNVARRLAIVCPQSTFKVASWQKIGTCIRIDLPLGWAKTNSKGG